MTQLTHDQLVQHIYALHQTLLDVERAAPDHSLMRRCVLDSISRHHHVAPPADFATVLLPIAYHTYTSKIPVVQS
jgi:hypothetical protein